MFFDKIKDERIDMVVAVRILWDIAGRPQDLLALGYKAIKKLNDGRGSIEFHS